MNPIELLRLLICLAGILSSLAPPGYAECDTLPPGLTAWPQSFDTPAGVNLSCQTPSTEVSDIISCVPPSQVTIVSFIIVQQASGRPLTYVKPRPCNSLLSLAWNLLLLQAGDVEANPGPPTPPLNTCCACEKKFAKNARILECAICCDKMHLLCTSTKVSVFNKLRKDNALSTWICQRCSPMDFSGMNKPTGAGNQFPCGVCQKNVSFNGPPAVQCDNSDCKIWIHKHCASTLTDSVFDAIGDASWQCYGCRCVHGQQSFIYQAYNLNISNSFAPLAGLPCDDSVFMNSLSSPNAIPSFQPQQTSSPILGQRRRPPRSDQQPGSLRLSSSAIGSESTSASGLSSVHDLLKSPGDRNNLRIGVCNANSIKGKRAEIQELLNYTQCDIVLTSETKLPSASEKKTSKKAYDPAEILPKNYDGSIHRPRNLNGGGVMIIVRKGIVCEEVSLKAGKDGEIVCAKISIAKSSPLYVCAYYRPPSDTENSLDSLNLALEELEEIVEKNPRTCVIVGGDFNAPGINWSDMTTKPDASLKGMCSRLIGILSTFSLSQLQTEPTRQNAVLDLFCTNKPGLVKNISLTPGISDHDGVIVVDMSLKAIINKKPQRKIPLWSKADWKSIKENAVSFATDFLTKCENRSPEENWNDFKNHMKAAQNAIPSKLSSERTNLPWLTTEVKRLCRKKRKQYNKAKKSKDPSQWAKFKHLQNQTRNTLRKAHWNYVNAILQEGLDAGDSKKFWRYVKAQQQDGSGVAPLRTGTSLHTDATSKAKALSDQFSSVFTKDSPETADTKLEGPSYPTLPDLQIERKGVELLLSGLNPSKASGPDEIPARMLKTLSAEIAPVLTAIFNQSLDSGYLPAEWTCAWITPVFKKGAKSDPANYRPVSLTSIACKLLEHCICTHVRGHLDAHGILSPANHGFRKNHSCETQLLLTTHDLLRLRDQGYQVDVAILDFSKAFDTVPHKRLLGKLEHYGIKGNVHRWIGNFLSGRKQSVVVDGSFSRQEDVLSGVPQGTVLGPLLFLLHINDLPASVDPDTRCRLFADDCLLYRKIESIEDQLALQNDLRRLQLWAAQWGMRFNASKCYIMSIHRGSSHLPFLYELCNTVLTSVTEEKYLGVLIADDLSWTAHRNSVLTKANQKLGFLRRNLRGCPEELKKLAYISIVRSSMEYASIIWEPYRDNHSKSLEAVQRKSARWIKSNYRRKASVTHMMNSLELNTLQERRRISRLVFLYKVLKEPIHKDSVAVQPSDIDIVISPRKRRTPKGQPPKTTPKLDYSYIATSDELLEHFVARTVGDWNELLQSQTAVDTASSFKCQLQPAPCP